MITCGVESVADELPRVIQDIDWIPRVAAHGWVAVIGNRKIRDGAEVDLVVEADDGRVVAIEVKATSTPRPEDFRWLAYLRDRLDRVQGEFTVGIVLPTGQRRLPFGDRLVALPAYDLWS